MIVTADTVVYSEHVTSFLYNKYNVGGLISGNLANTFILAGFIAISFHPKSY
jgi:hypothetical protein